ncbi:MAG: hypothetical protein LBJ77_02900 [Holosporales bacterium]|nr:hypothetical protein [Holosporales bacterium]
MPMPPWVQPRAKKPAPKVMEPLPPIPGRPAFCQVRDYLAFENWEGNPHRDTTQYPQILAATQKDKVHRSRPSYRAAAQQLNKEVIVGSKLSTNEVKAKAVEVFGNWECGAAEGVPAAIIVNIGMFREALAEADPESEITFWQLLKATEGGMIHFANKVDQLSPKLGQHPVITKSCIAFRGARERPTGTKIKDEVEYD